MRILFLLMSLSVLFLQDSILLEQERVIKQLHKRYKGGSFLPHKIYLVTGLDGCGSCLEYTVNFIEKNISNTKIMVIVSGQSKVQLRNKFSLATRLSHNFVFDTLLIPLKSNIIEMSNPKVWYCKNGKLVKSESIDYRNAKTTFERVERFLKE